VSSQQGQEASLITIFLKKEKNEDEFKELCKDRLYLENAKAIPITHFQSVWESSNEEERENLKNQFGLDDKAIEKIKNLDVEKMREESYNNQLNEKNEN
jgi:hypothetical protein